MSKNRRKPPRVVDTTITAKEGVKVTHTPMTAKAKYSKKAIGDDWKDFTVAGGSRAILNIESVKPKTVYCTNQYGHLITRDEYGTWQVNPLPDTEVNWDNISEVLKVVGELITEYNLEDN